MSILTEVRVSGMTAEGTFEGRLNLHKGMNVISARNAYGKSLAVTAIPWCLGLEPMFGAREGDPARFPTAVRDVITLGDALEVPVLSSEASITLERSDGATITLVRSIKGGDTQTVEVLECCAGQDPRRSLLNARRRTMADETGGLQRFLFDWMGLPRIPVMTAKGKPAQLYLENLVPLLFIDQTEGWTDLQALQVYRYQLQEVSEIAVEYLLGAHEALASRYKRQGAVAAEARLKAQADELAARTRDFCKTQGWEPEWSSHGSLTDILKRWSRVRLSELLHREFNMDVAAERKRIDEKIASLRKKLSGSGRGEADLSPVSKASQEAIELKTLRHRQRADLRDARLQLEEQRGLLATIEHRAASSKDVLRLKTEGIGRLDVVQCPTCKTEVTPSTFELTEHSIHAVQAC